MSTLIDLDRPKAKIVARHGFRVYGWTRELVTDCGTVPMSELVSIHAFEWTARRAMRRWLKRQTATEAKP